MDGAESVCTPGTPAADDATCNGVDEDCDGTSDVAYVVDASCGTGECQTNNTPSSCVAGAENVCTPGTPCAVDATDDADDQARDGPSGQDNVVKAS